MKNLLRQFLLYLLVENEGLVFLFFHFLGLTQACSFVEEGEPILMVFNYLIHFLLQPHLRRLPGGLGFEPLSSFNFK